MPSRCVGGRFLGPVGMCVFFQKSVKLINPLLNADYGGFHRAAEDCGSRTQFTRLKYLKLPLKLGAHFYPILNEVMDRSHAIDTHALQAPRREKKSTAHLGFQRPPVSHSVRLR